MTNYDQFEIEQEEELDFQYNSKTQNQESPQQLLSEQNRVRTISDFIDQITVEQQYQDGFIYQQQQNEFWQNFQVNQNPDYFKMQIDKNQQPVDIKILLGLECMVTLEEKSLLDSDLKQMNVINQDVVPNLEKIFNEDSEIQYYQKRKMSQCQKQPEIKKISQILEDKYKSICGQINQDIINSIEFNLIFSNLYNFENFLYIEQIQNQNQMNFHFQSVFQKRYQQLLYDLQQTQFSIRFIKTQNQAIEFFENMLQKIISFQTGIFDDLFNFIANCSGQFCFDAQKQLVKFDKSDELINIPLTPTKNICKNKQDSSHQDIFQDQQKQKLCKQVNLSQQYNNQTTLNPQQNLLISKQNYHQSNYQQTQKINPPSQKINPPTQNKQIDLSSANQYIHQNTELIEESNILNKQKSDTQSMRSLSSNEIQKKKKWNSQEEITELENLVQQYYPQYIPIQKIEEFSKIYDRPIISIKNKIQQIQKSKQKQMEINFQLQLKQKQNKNHKQQNKLTFTVPIEQMLLTILKQQQQPMTKDIIFERVVNMFGKNDNNLKQDDWKKTASVYLSSSSQIMKQKGVFSMDKQYIELNKDKDKLTMRQKLIHVMSQLPNNRGTLKDITNTFIEQFTITKIDNVNQDQIRGIKNNIQKTLLQNYEFNRHESKSTYQINQNRLFDVDLIKVINLP